MAVVGVIGLAGVIALSDNSEVDLTIGQSHVHGRSDGFLNSLTKFLDKKQERQMQYEIFKDSIQRLKVHQPDSMWSSKDSIQ